MERICKNCGNIVYEGKNYCSHCGSKWIENRITLRNVASDFTDLYVGLDTKIGRTLIDLFLKPQDVIKGYVNGRRMGYVDPIRYVLISLLFSGLYIYLVKLFDLNIFDVQQDDSFYRALGYTDKMIEDAQKFNSDFAEKIGKYQSVIVFCTIPVLALIGRLTFWGKRHFNFTEQVVVQMYTYAHVVICSTPITIALSFVSVQVNLYWSMFMYPLMIAYNAYVYKRILRLDKQQIILKTLIFIIWLFVVLILIIIVSIFLGALLALFFEDQLKAVIT